MQKPFALDIPFDDWPKIAVELGMKKFSANQIISWMYQKNTFDPEKMSDLSKDGRKNLAEKFSFELPKISETQTAKDGTTKIAIKLFDGNVVESVLIPDDKDERTTVCISTQVGCTLGCEFCRTAKMGFKRNLTIGEILSQLIHLKNISKKQITNIVFMGMGEPLLNIENLEGALKYITDERAMNFAKRRITVSTAGIVKEILPFFQKHGVKLAVSLNAATHETRAKLMPIEKKYPLDQIIEVCREYSKESRFKITFEYVMLKGINDTEKELSAISKLLKDVRAKINLIPFNTFEGCAYEPSDEETIKHWWKTLYEKGIQINIRKSKGQEILAACGQLAGKKTRE